jgi:hypothetical protein
VQSQGRDSHKSTHEVRVRTNKTTRHCVPLSEDKIPRRDTHDRPNSVPSLGRGMVSGNTAKPVIKHSSWARRNTAVQQAMGTNTNSVRLGRRESISKILLILPRNIEKDGCNFGLRVAIVLRATETYSTLTVSPPEAVDSFQGPRATGWVEVPPLLRSALSGGEFSSMLPY